GKDPETRFTAAGDPVANFSVAVTEKYNGNETTEWFNCVAFKKTAEVVQKYLTKGSSVLIEGKIQTREWEKDGVKRKSIQVIVREIDMCGGGRKKADAEPTPEPSDYTERDEIPF
ncbi:MAG: single-stranded DNA-binding protein, partial [Bacilli bacterium]